MERKNGITITRITTILTGDLDFIETYSSDVMPYQILVDKTMVEENEEIADFLKEYPKEMELLQNGDIDYIVIEYDY